jgi:dTDP-4-dehydrorhamnose 3,5-epimerase
VRFKTTELPGVILVEPDVHRDERGFFLEIYQAEKYAEAGIHATFVQDNHSRSRRGTLRGFHAQLAHPQSKLVRVIEGEVLDVALDIRRGSPSFARHAVAALSAENFRQLYIPEGFAHAFLVTSDVAQVEYKCTDFYDPAGEIAIAWNDPDLAIDWPIRDPILAKRDAGAPRLRDLVDRLPVYTPA